MRYAGWLVAAALALLLGLRECAGDRETARLAARADSLKVEVVNLQGEVAAQRIKARLDSLRADSVKRADDARLLRARSRIVTILDTATVLDSAGIRLVREEFDSLHATTDTALAHRDERIAKLEATVAWFDGTVIPQKDAQLAEAQRLLHEALAAKRPRTSCGLSVVAGYGTAGLGATVGYGCTIRLP